MMMDNGLEVLSSSLENVENSISLEEAHKRTASFKSILLRSAIKELMEELAPEASELCGGCIGYDSFFKYLADVIDRVIDMPGGLAAIQYMIDGEIPRGVTLNRSETNFINSTTRSGLNRHLKSVLKLDAKDKDRKAS